MPAFAGMTEEFAWEHLSNLPAVRRRSRTNSSKLACPVWTATAFRP